MMLPETGNNSAAVLREDLLRLFHQNQKIRLGLTSGKKRRGIFSRWIPARSTSDSFLPRYVDINKLRDYSPPSSLNSKKLKQTKNINGKRSVLVELTPNQENFIKRQSPKDIINSAKINNQSNNDNKGRSEGFNSKTENINLSRISSPFSAASRRPSSRQSVYINCHESFDADFNRQAKDDHHIGQYHSEDNWSPTVKPSDTEPAFLYEKWTIDVSTLPSKIYAHSMSEARGSHAMNSDKNKKTSIDSANGMPSISDRNKKDRDIDNTMGKIRPHHHNHHRNHSDSQKDNKDGRSQDNQFSTVPPSKPLPREILKRFYRAAPRRHCQNQEEEEEEEKGSEDKKDNMTVSEQTENVNPPHPCTPPSITKTSVTSTMNVTDAYNELSPKQKPTPSVSLQTPKPHNTNSNFNADVNSKKPPLPKQGKNKTSPYSNHEPNTYSKYNSNGNSNNNSSNGNSHSFQKRSTRSTGLTDATKIFRRQLRQQIEALRPKSDHVTDQTLKSMNHHKQGSHHNSNGNLNSSCYNNDNNPNYTGTRNNITNSNKLSHVQRSYSVEDRVQDTPETENSSSLALYHNNKVMISRDVSPSSQWDIPVIHVDSMEDIDDHAGNYGVDSMATTTSYYDVTNCGCHSHCDAPNAKFCMLHLMEESKESAHQKNDNPRFWAPMSICTM